MRDTSFKLDFLLENTDFYTDDESKPMLLGFKLIFNVVVKEDYVMEGDVLLHFNPKIKEFVLCEFTLGKGYEYCTLSINHLCDNSNKSKVNIKEPEAERNYIFMSLWKQSGSDFDMLKMEAYKNWWAENFNNVRDYVLANKKLYNDTLVNQLNKILID